MKSGKLKRRDFLGYAGVGLTATAIGAMGTVGEAASKSKTPAALLNVIDFHNHYVGPAFTARAGAAAPPAQRPFWDKVNASLAQEKVLIESLEASGVAGRVLSTPLEFVKDADGEMAPDTIQRINDQLADLAARHPGRLYGLATVDAYSGDDGARELNRAVLELGLRGVFVESAKGDLLLDAPQARPTLAAAAALNVPVFVHPITDPALQERFRKFGRLGSMLGRGTINAAALFALLEGGVFDELPALRVVVTTLAIGGVLLAGGFGEGNGIRRDAPEIARRHVYIDTMGLHPALIASGVELLGANHVLAGTDWPIFAEKSVPKRLALALSSCGLDEAQQQMIASGNALKLMNRAS